MKGNQSMAGKGDGHRENKRKFDEGFDYYMRQKDRRISKLKAKRRREERKQKGIR